MTTVPIIYILGEDWRSQAFSLIPLSPLHYIIHPSGNTSNTAKSADAGLCSHWSQRTWKITPLTLTGLHLETDCLRYGNVQEVTACNRKALPLIRLHGLYFSDGTLRSSAAIFADSVCIGQIYILGLL